MCNRALQRPTSFLGKKLWLHQQFLRVIGLDKKCVYVSYLALSAGLCVQGLQTHGGLGEMLFFFTFLPYSSIYQPQWVLMSQKVLVL